MAPPVHSSSGGKARVLFVAEAVTLAHVARPATLAAALDRARWDVHFAHHPRYRHLLGATAFEEHPLHSIEPADFVAALASGRPLYDTATLQRYVEEEAALLRELRPDVVVGDFRLSLPVSAQLAGIPCITLANACWSPYTRQHYPVPDLPLTRALGVRAGQLLFAAARPLAFALHSLPMRALRRRHGLPGLGLSLQRVYTHGDYTLYADIPGLYEMTELPPNHRVIGTVPWSPAAPLPAWWDTLPGDRPLLYVTPGSSGHAELLPAVLAALADLPVRAMVATAGAPLASVPDNVHVADYLPGDAAAQRADLVVCNGGSPTTQQALACGRPMLGIATNLDQYLNMQTLENAGAGICLRSDRLGAGAIVRAIRQLLEGGEFARRARELAGEIRDTDGVRGFTQFLEDPSAPWSPRVAKRMEASHA